MSEQLYLYILMRKDLPSMGAGRAAAQASHAANAFWHECGHTAGAKQWAKETPQGFGTAIVLGVTLAELREVTRKAMEMTDNCCVGSVIDPDYVITVPAEVVPCIDDKKLAQFEQSPSDPSKYLFHREEITCAYIFGDKEKLSPLLAGLPLYS